MPTTNTYTGLEVAVIGMAGRFPGAPDIKSFWHNLANGVESIQFFTEEELLQEGEDPALIDEPDYVRAGAYLEGKQFFDAAFFQYRPDEARLLDPQIRIFHECVWAAIEDAGYNVQDDGQKVGLFAGASGNTNWEIYAKLLNEGQLTDPFTAQQLSDVRFMATRIAYLLNLRGPAVYVDTACSTSLVAIHQACRSLVLGECTMAIAGGVSVSNKPPKGYLYQEGMIYSKDGHCRTFDANASGTISGEGAGVVVLKLLKHALKDKDQIWAIVRGSGMNNDGNHKVGYTAPSIDGQAEAIMMAHKWAKVVPESISYIETHGTATALGDPVEVKALHRVFGDSREKYCALGAVKSNLGHLDAAAGVTGFIKTVLALKHRQIPPSLHFTVPNPAIDFEHTPFYVNTVLKEWKNEQYPLRAGVSSFGIGGTNVHMVLEEAPEQVVSNESHAPQLLVLSAQSPAALQRNKEQLIQYLQKNPAINFSNIAYTLQIGRVSMPYRKAFVCSSHETAIQEMTTAGAVESSLPVPGNSKPYVVFMFPGQGSQYVNMFRDLYHSEAAFRETMDNCFAIAQSLGLDFRQVLFAGPASETTSTIDQTEYAQPALFAVEYALARLLMKWGIQPDNMIGHSIGEYVAACISNVFSLPDAMALVIQRGRLMQQAQRGTMLSIPITPEELHILLADHPGISLAAINSSAICVVSGTDEAIATFTTTLDQKGYRYKTIRTSHAFHSHLFDDLLPAFEKEVGRVNIQQLQIPFLSNLTGQQVTDALIGKPSYWSQHLRQTVLFSKGIETILERDNVVLIELGPGKVLSALVQANQHTGEHHAIVQFGKPPGGTGQDVHYLLNGIGKIWERGVAINWQAWYNNEPRQKISLPTYSFERTAFTATFNLEKLLQSRYQGKALLPGSTTDTVIHIPGWRSTILPGRPAKWPQSTFTFLVFGGAERFSQALVHYLKASGQRVLTITPGDTFSVKTDDELLVNMEDRHSLKQCWQYLESHNIPVSHLIYCNTLYDTTPAIHYDVWEQRMNEGYLGLSCILQCIAGSRQTQPLHLTVLTHHTAAVTEAETIDPFNAMLHAPARIAPLEITHLQSKVIDLPYPFTDESSLQDHVVKVVKEIFYEDEQPFIAYRFGKRWTEYFSSLPVVNQQQEPPLTAHGVYIITGGFGGMGFTMANYLALQYNARLLLVHRSFFPQRMAWDQWLQEKGEEDAISKKILQLRLMEVQGASVQLYQVDLAIEEQVKNFIITITEQYPVINGLIWAAGEVDTGGILLNRTKEELLSYTTSKIHGLLLFEKYFDLASLDFVALFSSIGNEFYQAKFGQVAYNAANEFLEAYAQYKQKGGARVFTINWCDWLDVGMTVRTKAQEASTKDLRRINAAIHNGITPTEGVQLFLRCLKNDQPVSVIYRGNLEAAIIARKQEHATTRADYTVSPGSAPAADFSAEEKLIRLFGQFFGRDQVSVHDDFFELGGDSLKGIAMIARINQQLGTHLSIKDLYQHPTINGLLSCLETGNDSNNNIAIPRALPKPHYPLSSEQKRMYFLQALEPESMAYNESAVLQVEGSFDKERLEQVLQQIIQRHESLRTYFITVNGEPRQVIAANCSLNIIYWEADERERAQQVRSFIQPFQLEKAPLLRIGVISHSPEKRVIILSSHHIVIDGASKLMLLEEIKALYHGQVLPEPSRQYKDYAEWQQSKQQQTVIAGQREWWINQFASPPAALQLPYDFPRPATLHYEGDTISFSFEPATLQQLKAIAATENTTLFTVLLSLYTILLHKLSGQEDVVIGTPYSVRQHIDWEQVAGMFVNTLALRNYPKGSITFRQFLREVKAVARASFENHAYPFEELVHNLKLERVPDRNPLFDVMLMFQSAKNTLTNTPGLQWTTELGTYASSRFDLTFSMLDTGTELAGTVEYATGLFKRNTIERFIDFLVNMVKDVVAHPDTTIAAIQMMPAEEKQQVLHQFNPLPVVYPRHKTIHALFEETAKACAQETALVFEGRTYSYETVNARSNQLARKILQTVTGQDTIVGILVQRSPEMIISLLAVLKAGLAYLPIDPQYPRERIRYVVDNSGLSLLLTDPSLSHLVDGFDEQLRVIDVTAPDCLQVDDSSVPAKGNGSSLAYLIYTSGSTGNPKGVMIEHRNVINFLYGITEVIPFKQGETVLSLTTISFDIFVMETIVPLLRGMKVVIASVDDQQDPHALARLIRMQGANMMQLTPSHLKALLININVQPILESVHTMMVGGEAFPLELLQELQRRYRGRIFNMYGPTETTVWSTVQELTKAETVNIGKPIANTVIRIVDAYGQCQPIGIAGELCIGGEGVGRGYWLLPGLTHERFMPDPIHPQTILYKTGDSARWLPDGNIAFIGRIDNQVKIRGHRIEPGEIEQQLQQHEQIGEAVVMARGKDADKFLVAYYTAPVALAADTLRPYLLERLPHYMVPSFFVQLSALPLTPNGKLDRKALPDPEIQVQDNYVGPANETEEKLVHIWSEVLEIAPALISVNRNFFELGGHSLKATAVVNKMNKTFEVAVPLKEIFNKQNIESLADYLMTVKQAQHTTANSNDIIEIAI